MDELHVFNDDFCGPTQRDWLLSFQLRKLIQCLDILYELNPNNKGTGSSDSLNGLYRQAIKGRFKARPFAFNNILNILEAR